jgi:two-component system NtrC family sensor kinase
MVKKGTVTELRKPESNGRRFQAEDVDCKSKDEERSAMDMRSHAYYDPAVETRGSVLVANDIVQQRTAEKGFMRSDKLALLGRLSANLAHELGNPLGGVLRYMRLLLDQMPEDDSRRIYAEHAQDGLMRMASVIETLLGFARMSMSTPRPIDIPQSIRRVLSFFSHWISTQDIRVEAEFDENIPVIMNTDVEQIFMNIIKNAIQAMPNGGTLSVKARMLSPGLFEARFGDTGPGIPDEIREMIFEPFFTTKNFAQCVGLGLSISQEISESYDGSIDVESELGKGTTFVVRLPVSKTGLGISDMHSTGPKRTW